MNAALMEDESPSALTKSRFRKHCAITKYRHKIISHTQSVAFLRRTYFL